MRWLPGRRPSDWHAERSATALSTTAANVKGRAAHGFPFHTHPPWSDWLVRPARGGVPFTKRPWLPPLSDTDDRQPLHDQVPR